MKINFGKLKKSSNYDSVAEQVLRDSSKIRLLNTVMSISEMQQFAKEHKIEIHEVTMLRQLVSSHKKINSVQGMDVRVERKEAGYQVHSETPCVVMGALMAQSQIDGDAIQDRTIAVLFELLNFDKNTISVVPLPACKSDIQVNTAPVTAVAAQFVDKNIVSKNAVHKELKRNMMDVKGSAALSKIAVEVAPKAAKMEVAQTSIGDKRLTVVKPKKFVHTEFNEKTAKSVLYKQQQLTYPSTSSIAGTAARHVNGIPIPSAHRKYYELLTDLKIPDGVTDVHLYHNDIAYATAIRNAYPDVKVAIVGTKAQSDKNCFLSFITKRMAREQLKNNLDTIIGVWVVPDDKTQPNNEARALSILNDDDNTQFVRYKHAFRPLNVHAMRANKDYGCSIQVRRCVVIDGSSRGKSYKAEQMYGKVAAGLLHSYFFPFVWSALDVLTDDYPKPLQFYSTISKEISNNNQMLALVRSFIGKDSVAEFDHLCVASNDNNDGGDDNDDSEESIDSDSSGEEAPPARTNNNKKNDSDKNVAKLDSGSGRKERATNNDEKKRKDKVTQGTAFDDGLSTLYAGDGD